MATYKLYDIGTVSDSTYMYKGVYRVGTQLSSVASYELLIVRFNLSDGSIDPNYGQQQQGAFRAHFQIKPANFPLDLTRLCPGIMFDVDGNITFAGIAWMSGLSRHGFYIAKLDNTGKLTTYGSGNYGISVGGFDTSIYSCTKELLVDKSNNCIFGVSTREYTGDVDSPSYISRRNSNGDTDNSFGNNGKVEISQTEFTPQITSLTFDNYGNYYVGYNTLKNDGSVFGNSYIKSYNYSGGENTYFSNNGKVIVDAGANFAAEAPQDLGSEIRDQYLDDVKVFLTMNDVNNSTSLTDPVGGHNISFIGNAKISTDNKKFGSSSLRLDGTNNSYLQIGTNNNPSDIPLTDKDFCIEMMLYLDAVDNERRILSLGGNTSATGLLIESLNSGDNLNSLRVMMGTHTGGNSNVVNLVAKNCLIEKEWQHLAYVRKDTNVYLYVDGELKAASLYEGSVNLGSSGSLKLGSDQNGENGMIGNIDDFRLTIGNSRYFNTFKVPEHQISNVGENTDVKLLLHFEGDNNSKTVTDRGISKITTCSCLGNAEISSDKHKFGETSLKLDGVNSLVEVPDSKINWPSTFYTQPFTIEGYFNFSNTSNRQVLIKKNNSILIEYLTVPVKMLAVTLQATNNQTSRFEYQLDPTIGSWYHIALVKNGVNVALFLDGQKVINSTYLGTIQDGGSSEPWDIGANRAGGTDYFNGYIDEVRIVASAVYTEVFTPAHHQFFPTQEHAITSNDNYANQVDLLLHFEEVDGSDLVDSSSTDASVALDAGSLNSDNARFGSKSLSVPASGTGCQVNKLQSNEHDIFPASDYTIEMYFKLNQGVNDSKLFKTSGNGLILKIQNSNNQISLGTSESLTGNNYNAMAGSTPAPYLETDRWYHVAVVRKDGDIKTYLDGSLRSTNSEQNNNAINGTYNIGENLDGYIDELRITNGIARYTSNFTPQTSAFGSEPVPAPEPQYKTADYSNSKLLLHLDDVSSNALSAPVDDSGDNKTVTVVQDSRNGFGGLTNVGRNTSITKFGGQSWKFDNRFRSGQYLHANNTTDLGTQDWCIDWWWYPTNLPDATDNNMSFLNCGYSGSQEPIKIYYTYGTQGGSSSNAPRMTLTMGSGGNIEITALQDLTPHLNKWTHTAVVRDGATVKIYINGDLQTPYGNSSTFNIPSTTIVKNVDGFKIGDDAGIAGRGFKGYIDEFHVRVGTPVYTSNFTVPAYAHGKQPVSYTEPTPYFNAKSELSYMLPLTQTSSFLALAKKTNSNNTTYAEVLNIKHGGEYLNTWAGNGKLALTVPGYSYINPETMWMDRELNLYVGGSAQKISNGLKDGVVWKIMPSGVVDATFGNGGVDIKDNTTLDESITSMYNDYANNKMIYTSLFTGDSGSFTNHPMMIFDNYNFGGNLTFLSSYDYITKETTPSEGLNRVLQDMGLTNAAHIKMPASMFNNLLGTYNEVSNSFPVNDVVLNVDQSANDNITVVSGGLIKDFWNYFISKIETIIPANKRNLWDDSADGANGYTNAKLQTFFRDVGLGSLTVPQVNDVIREYEANASSIFPYRAGIHRREGFVAGDKAGINAGVQITFQTTISAATGGTLTDTVISETRTFNVLLELE